MHTFDHTLTSDVVERVTSNPDIHFHAIGVGSQEKDERLRHLHQIMTGMGHTWLDVLKMDIEGAEWELLQHMYSVPKASLKATQLLMEVHFPNNLTVVLETFDKLLADNYRVFSVEPNYYCEDGCCAKNLLEFAFIKVSDRGKICTPDPHARSAQLKLPAGC